MLHAPSRQTIARAGRTAALLPVLLMLVVVVGCATLPDVETAQERAAIPAGPIDGGRAVGQTIAPRRPGLAAIELILIVPDASTIGPDDTIALRLRDEATSETLRESRLPLAGFAHNARIRFDFEPIDASADRRFRLEVAASTPDGTGLSVWATDESLVPDGGRYRDGVRVVGALAVRPWYRYGGAALVDDLVAAPAWLAALLVAVGVLLVPGLALARALAPSLPGWTHWGAAPGLSLATWALGAQWLSVADVRVDRLVPALTVVAGLAALAVTTRPSRLSGWRPSVATVVVVAALVATAAIRAIAARDLAFPPWVDSVHHAFLVGAAREQGRVPVDMAQYAELGPLTYHYGFHAAATALAALANLDPALAVLVAGQSLSALSALAVGSLAAALARGATATEPVAELPPTEVWSTRPAAFPHPQVAALTAVAIVGLVSVMPAYYLSWGRYTQLAGLVALCAAATLLLAVAIRPRDPALVLLASLAAAGTFVVHPRAAVLLAGFGITLVIVVAGQPVDFARPSSLPTIARVVVLSALLAAPALLTAMTSTIPRLLEPSTTGELEAANALDLGLLQAGHDRWLAALAVAGALVGIVRRRAASLLVVCWWLLGLLAANPGWVGLPGSYLLSNGAVVISLFIPIAIFAGEAITGIADAFARVVGDRVAAPVVAIAVLVVAIATSGPTVAALNPATAIATRADRDAIDWVRASVGRDALWLINPTLWHVGTHAGSDGGYWLSAYGYRATLPPLLHGLAPPAVAGAIGELNRRLIGAAEQPDELDRLVREAGVTHVYFGQRGGVLRPSHFLTRPGYRLLYRAGGVHVFAVETGG